MEFIDWLVVVAYLLFMLGIAFRSGKRQLDSNDYFLGGRQFSSISLAASTIATQCSTNSLLGAPAFVGFVAGGGLIWLQYELAVPLAMLFLLFLLIPARTLGVTSIYQVLGTNLGKRSQITAAGCFLFFRAIATGVTIYGSALVISFALQIDYLPALLILMLLTVIYDIVGGLRAVVISDVIQLILLTTAVLVSLVLIGDSISWDFFSSNRDVTLLNDWGFSGNDYGFWPMLFGGIFLYAAYYGCDQSQAQRILATKSPQETGKVLVLNGLFRFPLVLLYCFLGLGLAIFSLQDAQLIDSLPLLESGKRNYNLVFPQFISQNFSPGLVGLVLVGLVAAAMSSIDSALNSLAAVTVEDFIKPKLKNQTSGKDLLRYGRICTIFWAIFAIAFSFYVEDIAPTVLEAVNKIGSMVNGPILALVTISILAGKRARESFALIGFWCGLVSNFLTACLLPDVSWLWWNMIGFCVSILSFNSLEKLLPRDSANFDLVSSVIIGFGSKDIKNGQVIVLALMFSFVMVICLLLNKF